MFRPKFWIKIGFVEQIGEFFAKFRTKPAPNTVFPTVFLGLSLVLVACAPKGGDAKSNTVTILGVMTGEGEQIIEQILEPFTKETGIKVVYEASSDFATLLPVLVESGNAPDLAMFPQPGLMADFAREGQLVPLDTFMDKSQLSAAYSQNWLDLATVDSQVYGVWIRAAVKSLVWYNRAAFKAAGYKIPNTWNEMMALSDQIVADGGVPWCIGIESGAATGWVGTDWIEDIILRTVGGEVYDQWVAHNIPFNHPAVKNAFEQFGNIALNPKYVFGGTVGIISTPFGDAAAPLFDNPPVCYLHRQASFITSFLPKDVALDKDVSIFLLPGIKQELGVPVLVSGIVTAMFKDTPEARKLMEYLSTAQPHTIWASQGDYVSPHKQVSLDAYPNDILKRQAEILANADMVRFDGSDMMPGAVGTGTFWSGIVDYIGGTDVDTVLKTIEDSWPD
ncbi:ABC transporter substrate-binding protein [Moorena producens JHB]|uniref:ABC transporter substrate-binding protein n=1 Tax=Moorena producens (strain JHB) TaxID=1454205 RepID=A0A1D9GBA0_MOOP1|nr:ABC transporter substrate-binding protein [Moorena producens]AOY84887.2 ABC transporter substrate-binding protein [Moorena producens JHB]